MPISFYIFLVSSFVALLPAYWDHGKTWGEIKLGLGNRNQNILKLFVLWIIPILTIIGTVFLGVEALTANKQEKQHENEYRDVSNSLVSGSSQLQVATNELTQISSNITNIDPLNRPVESLTASVFIEEQGTNRTKVDPNKSPADAIFLIMYFGRPEIFTNGGLSWQAGLICTHLERVESVGGSGGRTDWFAEYDLTGLGHMLGVIAPNLLLRDAVKWDTITIRARFLPKDTEIIGGDVKVKINSIDRKFVIQPQKVGSGNDPIKLGSVNVVSW